MRGKQSTENAVNGSLFYFKEWLKKNILREKLNNPLGYVLFFFLALFIGFFIGRQDAKITTLIIGALVLLPLCLASFLNFRFGFLFVIVLGFSIFHLIRIAPVHLPLGTSIELFLLITVLGLLKDQILQPFIDWRIFHNPVTYVLLIWLIYGLLQVANPYAFSIQAWLFSLRGLFSSVAIYFVGMVAFSSFSFIGKFTKLWLILAFAVALYGFHQEYVGFFDFEWEWIYEEPRRFGLIFIWGKFRKWSFLSDVASYGVFMSASGIFCLILSLGPFKTVYRAVLIISGLMMLYAMSFSGTRTAIAMVPAGLALYVLMTINHKRSFILMAFAFIAFIFLFFGPFYGAEMRRFRSTFESEEDASMNVRDINRERIQPYIYDHPFGGGVGTTGTSGEQYAPGHTLAGFPPDSGYLATALEKGWIGLILTFSVYLAVMMVGISAYYQVRNRKIKIFYAAYLAAFFALTVAHYAQDVIYQKPIGLIVLAIHCLVVRLKDFDDSP